MEKGLNPPSTQLKAGGAVGIDNPVASSEGEEYGEEDIGVAIELDQEWLPVPPPHSTELSRGKLTDLLTYTLQLVRFTVAVVLRCGVLLQARALLCPTSVGQGERRRKKKENGMKKMCHFN